MKNTSLALLFLFIVNITFSQEEEKKSSFKISSFNISLGTSQASISSSKTDYNNLKGMVDNPELFVNPDDFSDNYYYNEMGGGFSTKIQIGINPYCKKLGAINQKREIRMGIGINSGNRSSFSFQETESTLADTYYSVNGNPNIYQEQLNTEEYSYSEQYTELNFSLSYLFKTDIKKRVHFYTGFGVEYGFTLLSFVDIYHYESSTSNFYTSTNYNNQTLINQYSNGIIFTSQSDRTNISSPTHFIRAQIPIGINLRFSNNHSFFKHLNIYSELNPGIEIQMAPNNFTYTNPYLGVVVAGLSYKF